MIDPDNIPSTIVNNNTNLTFADIPEYDFLTWDLESDKELRKYFTTIEKEIRKSYEYRSMIQYLKDNMGMDRCTFIKTDKDKYNVKIEIHHYPFTLYDIVLIVYRKRVKYQESLDVEMIAKECTMLHYKLLVGLIPLSTTVHQLAHDGKIFIPVENVFGRYDKFVDIYRPFCDDEQIETLNRIIQYSEEQLSEVNNTAILNQNNITINNMSDKYKLPDMNNIQSFMNNRIEDIKHNNYRLPDKEKMIDSSIKEPSPLPERDDIGDKTLRPTIYFSRKE